ncbi:MAG: hypothetical protein FJ086_17490 [Deltaproteobacteria bacterium]|nr:hypothetical protein [Deltaproteobacteria bacterium]
MTQDPHALAHVSETASPDLEYHTREFTSGARGGGKVPADFQWKTNTKQYQEENGSGQLRRPAEVLREETWAQAQAKQQG